MRWLLSNQFVDVAFPPYTNVNLVAYNPASYTVQAHYAQGDSPWSAWVSPYSMGEVPSVLTFPGPGGSTVIALSSVPLGAAVLRLTRADFDFQNYTNHYIDAIVTVDVPLSAFTNGFYTIPAALAVRGPDGSGWYVQAVWPDGHASGAANAGDTWPQFYDGRNQLKQNLSFLLRAATLSGPFDYYVDSTLLFNPPNYSYAGPYGTSLGGTGYGTAGTLDWARPFVENFWYRNLIFTTNDVDASGYLNTGGGMDFYGNFYLHSPLKYGLVVPTNGTVIAAQLPLSQTRWMLPYWNPQDLGIQANGTQFTLPNNISNSFGLRLASALVTYDWPNADFIELDAGNSVTAPNAGYFYPEFQAPAFQTVGYYFCRPNNYWWSSFFWWSSLQPDPMPGNDDFSPTNATAQLMASVGQPFPIAAFAKLAITNGDVGKPAYLGQYFDRAYKMTNGIATTNQTGMLSPYGVFFPTEPGPAALVTMPDIDTGQRGTGVVNVIKLQLDVNHDGIMDTSFGGPDNTSYYKPFVFWINNDHDWSQAPTFPGQDLQVVGPSQYDCNSETIPSERDLEDWARLWICGVPALAGNQGYAVTLSLSAASGNPAINLMNAVETNGGTLYLTDTNTAYAQTYNRYGGNQSKYPRITPASPLMLPASIFTNAGNKYFLFEGAGIGSGELVLTISQGSNVIAQTGAWIDLHDVKDFYERAVITNNASGAISNWTSSIQTVQYPVVSDQDESQDIILYVHGASNKEGTWLMRGDTIFKRLYWAAYHGRFASVRWPSVVEPDLAWFNTSELHAYKAASSLRTYLFQLRNRFPDHRLHVLSHSQGGAIASEALSEGAPFDTLILSQVGMPASCYDVNAPTNADLLSREANGHTPDWQPMGYHGAHTNIAGRIVNFFATNDYNMKLWLTDQEITKPDALYSYDGTNAWCDPNLNGNKYLVNDTQESRAYVARSRTLGIGAQGPLQGQTSQGVIQSAVDVRAQFGFGDTTAEHSAFFTRPIQTVWPYYDELLQDCLIPIGPR